VEEGYAMVLRGSVCSGRRGISLLLAGLLPLFLFPMASAQEIQWIRQFGTALWDSGFGVSVDGAGNVYVVGETQGALPGQKGVWWLDAFVRKYDSDGNERWIRLFGSEWDDYAYGVSVDSMGNVYVVGATDGDAFLHKYDGNGNEIWTRQFGTGIAYGVSVDGAGNVYMVGYTGGTLPGQEGAGWYNSDAFVRKYNSDGEEIWTRRFGTERNDSARGVSVDSVGNVYVVGETGGTFPEQEKTGRWGTDAFVRKYDSNGNEVWTRQFGSEYEDSARRVSVDKTGNVYVVGYTCGTLPRQEGVGVYDAFLRKYDGSGKEIWTRQFGTEWSDSAWDVSVDKTGNVYVVGDTSGILPGQGRARWRVTPKDFFLRKYDSNGKEIWTRQFGTGWDDYAYGVSVDGAGNVYVVGRTEGTFPGQEGVGWDAFIVKFGPGPHPRIEDIVVLCAPHPVGKEGCVLFLRIPEDAIYATLNIYSVNGALILSIPIDPSKGRYPITGRWVPKDSNGKPLSTGTYLYLVEVRHSDGRVTHSKVQKMAIKR
jgi:hypothetical protein